MLEKHITDQHINQSKMKKHTKKGPKFNKPYTMQSFPISFGSNQRNLSHSLDSA